MIDALMKLMEENAVTLIMIHFGLTALISIWLQLHNSRSFKMKAQVYNESETFACRNCGRTVSRDATICPYCQTEHPFRFAFPNFLQGFGMVFVAVMFCHLLFLFGLVFTFYQLGVIK